MTKTRKEAWGTSLRLDDLLLDEGLWRLRLRQADDHAGASIVVNTYVYRGGGVLAVLDPGWPGTVDALAAALGDLGLASDLNDVDLWLYTHAHIDHMGAAALIERRSRGLHLALRALQPHTATWHAFQDRVHDWRPWIAEAFAEPHRAAFLAQRSHYGMVRRYGPAALDRVEYIDFGQTLQVGDLRLEFLDAHGHDPHHGVFFEPARGWLFSGDVALAVPTPICRSMHDELEAYRRTLDRVQALPARLLLPGHGLHRHDEIPAAFERAREFVAQYETLTRRALAGAGRPLDLVELSLRATPNQQPLTPDSRWWVHMALIDSHLAELVARSVAERVEQADGPRYVIK